MKNLIISIVLSSIGLISCNPQEIDFTEAQPSNTKSLQEFPKKLLGKYSNQSDTSVFEDMATSLLFDRAEIDIIATNKLEIQKKTILNHINGTFSVAVESKKDSIEIAVSSQNPRDPNIDSLILGIFKRANYNYEFQFQDDKTRTYSINLTDTVMDLDQSHVLKKIGKTFYLNIQSNKKYWNVYKLELKKRTELNISYLPIKHEIFLAKIMDKRDEHIGDNAYQPSKKSFKKLVKFDAFKKSHSFKK